MASIKRIGKDSLGVPIWEAVYRRTSGGKQVRRRFHLHTRAEVEREVLVDSQHPGTDLKWSEGLRLYMDAKAAAKKTAASMGNTARAVGVFIRDVGDIAIEKTTPEVMKAFMHRVATTPMTDERKRIRVSGPMVANHDRREMLAVANYIHRHTGKITSVPFASVPPFPDNPSKRSPIPPEKVMAYLDALPGHVRRPLEMVLYYGLRSSATCGLSDDAKDGGALRVRDKGDVRRRIPVDAFLQNILDASAAWKKQSGSRSPAVFVDERGRAWERTRLLRAAQAAWKAASLEVKTVHEVRHTLGTLAGRSFSPGMVQAAMGHRSRKSAEQYFHPDESMAAEVRRKIITEISQNSVNGSDESKAEAIAIDESKGLYLCPHCSHNILFPKRKGRRKSHPSAR